MKHGVMLLLISAACFTSAAPADLMSRFERTCPLSERPEKGTAARLRIPGKVFDECRSFPADVRILDSEGQQWPFFILRPVGRSTLDRVTPRMLNKAFVSGAEPHWEFDLVMPESNGLSVHNRLEIRTDGTDFVRRVEIERETGAGDRAHLASGYLISFPQNRNAQNQTVSYPDSDAPRLHVRVYSRAQSAGEPFEVLGATVSFVDQMAAEREPVNAVRCPVPDKETDNRTQTLILDCGFKYRPVELITFDVADASFVRCVSVLGRNAEDEPWRHVGGGQIHRFEKGDEDTVRVRASCRWLKINVLTDDNLPLEILGIRLEAVPRYLVFEAVTDQPARLCFRGWDVPMPAYDLEKRLDESAALALPVVALGSVESNPQGAGPSFVQRYSSALGGVAVGAVSLLTAWVIISMMRRTANPEH